MLAKYQHDCNSCVLVTTNDQVDVYVCPDQNYPNLVVRYGDEGSEYYADCGDFSRLIGKYVDKTPTKEN